MRPESFMEKHMLRIKSASRTLATSLLITLVTVFTVACGSSSDDFVINGNNGGNGGGNAGFTGQYLGANNLSNGQTGTLDFTVDSNGLGSGNFVAGAVSPQTIDISAGTYAVSGQVNLTTGAFSLTGSVPNVGPFTIVGTIPTGTNQANYQFTINGQTFQGVLQAASQGQPNPPASGNEGRLISGGTLANFLFQPDGSYNGVNPPVTGSSLISGAVGEGVNGKKSATVLLSETQIVGQSAIVRSLAITIVAADGNELVVGQTYPLASSADGDGVVIALSESEGDNVTEGWSLTPSTTGQAIITDLNDNSITIDFTFNSVGPNSEIENNPAVGTFSTSGLITGNFVATP